MIVSFRVFGVPKAQPRARAFARKFGTKWMARVYNPADAEGWKGAIALAAREHVPKTPLGGAVQLDVTLYFKRPKRLCGRKWPQAPFRHVEKPDRDNCDKAIMDVLTTLGFWLDDCQACDGSVRKFWEGEGQPPGALVELREIAVL